MVVSQKVLLISVGVAAAGTTVVVGFIYMRKRSQSAELSKKKSKDEIQIRCQNGTSTSHSPAEVSHGDRNANSPENNTVVSDNNDSSQNGKSTTEMQKAQLITPLDDLYLYFFDQVKIGTHYLKENNTNKAIEHLCNAVLVCSEYTEFLDLLKSSLPEEVYAALLIRLPEIEELWYEKLSIQ